MDACHARRGAPASARMFELFQETNTRHPRRKKCDEASPTCGDCKRLNLVCSKAPSTSRSNSESSPAIAESPRNSSIHDLSTSVYHGGTFSPNFDDDSPAAWSCDGDYSQTSLLDPTCDNQSIIQSAQIIRSLQNTTQQKLPLDPLSLKSPFHINEPKDQHLLRHFIRVVSRTLSVVHEDEANPFLSLIVPLAGTSKVVMESLLALSASHLRRVYPDILQRGLSHQNEGTAALPFTFVQRLTFVP